MKNTWDERYAAPGYVYGTEPNELVAAMAGEIPAGPVLCLAEGEGRNAVVPMVVRHPDGSAQLAPRRGD